MLVNMAGCLLVSGRNGPSLGVFGRSMLAIPARSGPFLGRPWLLISEPEPPVLRATLVACTGSAGHTYRRLGGLRARHLL